MVHIHLEYYNRNAYDNGITGGVYSLIRRFIKIFRSRFYSFSDIIHLISKSETL